MSGNRRWTEQEIATLVAGHAAKSPEEIAEELGRGIHGVKFMARSLGLAGKRGGAQSRRNKERAAANKALDPVLIDLHSKLSNPQIGLLLGRSAAWVMSQYQRLGLTRDPATVRKRRAANFGGDLPPEVRELVSLRTQLLRKINEQSKKHRSAA